VDESKGKIKSVPSDSGIAFLVVSQQSGMPGEHRPPLRGGYVTLKLD
jgi:hypothetical protein